MYIVITDFKIHCEKTLDRINSKLNSKLEEQEFKQVGADFIVRLDSHDLDFVQDKKRLSLIPMQSLFPRANKSNVILYFILLLNVILMLQGCMSSMNRSESAAAPAVPIERTVSNGH